MRRRLTSNDIQEEEDNMEMAKTTMNRKTAGKSNTVNLVLAALFLALGIILPFFTADSDNRKHAASDAYSCTDLRLCMRMAVRSGSRFYCAAASQHDVRDAAYADSCCAYGL